MLQSIRNHIQSWISWLIVGFIILTFALWGIQDYMGGGANAAVASVNGEEIKLDDFQRAYQRERERLRQALGSNFDTLSQDEARLKQQLLERVIRERVAQQAARDLGLRVSDAELAAYIQALPEFQDNGRFSSARYEQVLRSAGLTKQGFEALQRDDLLFAQLFAGLRDTAFVSAHQFDAAVRLQHQQREVSYLVIPADKFKDAVQVDDKAVQDHYAEQRERYTTPEQVSIEYLELAGADIAAGIKPDEETLRRQYQERKAQGAYDSPEQRRARHILISVEASADEAARAAARAKAEGVLQRLKRGEDFARLATEVSQDPVSAPKGGDLGWFGRSVMDKAFEEAVFALAPGGLSEPVLSPLGWHIIKLEESRPAHSKSFEEVRPELEQAERQHEADRQFFEQYETLKNLVFENPDTLDVASRELKLPLKTSAWFGQSGGEGIARDPKVVAAAFSDEVLARGYNSELIETGANHVLALRIKERKPAAQRPLDEVRAEIIAQLKQEAMQRRARQSGEELQKRLAQGEDAETLARQPGFTWVQAGMVGRVDAKLPAPVLRAAFTLPKTQPALGGARLDNGDYALVRVTNVREGDAAALSSAERLALVRELTRGAAERVYEDFVSARLGRADIARYLDRL
ncbi:MAG: peptidylprolyl isomerase [Gammaproteobacteria bacterium]|nr:MAG: peptidylprolyl isomerase [Gammaproteobacteria bacterium]